jgi:hypothetical protein
MDYLHLSLLCRNYNNILYENESQEFQSEYISPILKLSKKKKKQNKTPENSSDDSEANYSQPNVDQTKEKFKLTNIIDQNRSQLTNEEEEKQKHKKTTHSESPYKKHGKVK